MRYSRDRDRGLAELLGDVFSSGQPDPELLVRYGGNPQSLSADERQSVETHLAASPAYADQLKVLKNFDISALEAAAPAPTAPKAESPPSPPAAASPPAAEPERPAPIMLATATPSYRAPAGASPRFRPSSALRGMGSGLMLLASVPEHVAQSASEQPSLFWYLSELPRAGGEFQFTITDEESPDPLFQTKLDTPSEPGLQRIDLADFGVRLSPRVEFRWSVALRQDPARPSLDVVAQGWIERIETPAPVAERLDEADRADVPIIYAESGYWYEALSTVTDLIELYPENESLRQARQDLLKQVSGGTR